MSLIREKCLENFAKPEFSPGMSFAVTCYCLEDAGVTHSEIVDHIPVPDFPLGVYYDVTTDNYLVAHLPAEGIGSDWKTIRITP